MRDRTPLSRCTVPPSVAEILTAPAPMKLRVMFALFWLSDRLCEHRRTFEAGHLVGELGWWLREKAERERLSEVTRG